MPFWTPVLGGIQKGRAYLLPGALAMKAQRPGCGKTSHPRCLHRYNKGAHLAYSIHRLSGIPLQVRVGHTYPQDEANQKAASFRASPEITEHPHSPQHKLIGLRRLGCALILASICTREHKSSSASGASLDTSDHNINLTAKHLSTTMQISKAQEKNPAPVSLPTSVLCAAPDIIRRAVLRLPKLRLSCVAQ